MEGYNPIKIFLQSLYKGIYFANDMYKEESNKLI